MQGQLGLVVHKYFHGLEWTRWCRDEGRDLGKGKEQDTGCEDTDRWNFRKVGFMRGKTKTFERGVEQGE